MVANIGFVLLGLIVLLGAGDALVRGAVGLANRLNIPTLLIGLTIVAFGTSAPELVVSLQAVLGGDNGIAVGNIVGSNIANILLVLGLPALMASISLGTSGLGRHAAVMLAATGVFAYLVYVRGTLDPQVGVIMLGLIVAYIAFVGYDAMQSNGKDNELLDEVSELAAESGGLTKTLIMLAVGLIGLPLGGWLLVTYGAELARSLNIREEIIGLTVVAFGTSLPELATVWAAAMKRQADVAVGNIVGSNIFNILFVGGAASLAGTTEFTREVRLYDVPTMIAATIILALMIFAKTTITRIIGCVFVIAYVAYIISVSAGAMG